MLLLLNILDFIYEEVRLKGYKMYKWPILATEEYIYLIMTFDLKIRILLC